MFLAVCSAAIPFIAEASAATDVVTIFCRIFQYIYTIAIVVGIIYAVVAGYKYMSSGGDASKVSEAHKTLTWAAIGIAVALIAGGFPTLIGTIVGQSPGSACTF